MVELLHVDRFGVKVKLCRFIKRGLLHLDGDPQLSFRIEADLDEAGPTSAECLLKLINAKLALESDLLFLF